MKFQVEFRIKQTNGVKGMGELPFSEIEDAFYFVSCQSYGTEAYLCTKTGQLFYRSDLADFDEFPEDFEESAHYIRIPHKNELDLGRRLVDKFIFQKAPEIGEEVNRIFRRSGAYRSQIPRNSSLRYRSTDRLVLDYP